MSGVEMQSVELSDEMLLEVIKALVADELKSLRPEAAQDIFSEDWDRYTSIHSVSADSKPLSLQADSLEKLVLATRVTDFFQIRESGLEDYLLRYKTLGQWADLVAEARKRGTQNITFYTSGSTGQPKPCPQIWQSLVAEAEYFCQIFTQQLQQPIRRILALSPCQHIYGFLFSALLPELLQVPVIRSTKAFALAQGRHLQAGDLIIGFPFVWKQISRSQQAFPAGVVGITSTGPCDPQIIQQLKQQGLGYLVEIYGSSETGGLGWRQQTDQPFELLPRWQAIDGQSDVLLDRISQQQQPLNDRLHWQDNRHFFLSGRVDQAVQIAGINVFPALIAERLRQLPQVKDAVVRLMSSEEGDRLKAFVVPADPHHCSTELSRQLQDWCQHNLKTVERPRAFTFGSQLPRNSLGKNSDWPLQSTTNAQLESHLT